MIQQTFLEKLKKKITVEQVKPRYAIQLYLTNKAITTYD